MASKINEIFEKVNQQNLEKNAEEGDSDYQYKLGMEFYDKKDFRNAEYWLELAAKNETTSVE